MNNIKEFPWKYYSKDELYKEFTKLKNYIKNNNLKKIMLNVNVGQKCSNNFFQYYRFNTPAQNKMSCVEFWQKKQRYIQDKYKFRKQHYQNTIQFLNHCPSVFSSAIAGLIFKKFKAKNIFDPYSGWSSRLLAALAMNIEYTGCDCNTDLKKPYKDLIKFYDSTVKPKMYFEKSENIIKKLNNKKFDVAFSSPPFYNTKKKLLENYNKTETDYDKFMTKSLIPVMKYCLKNCKVVCFHLPTNMYDDLVQTFGRADKVFIFTASKNSKNKNHSTQFNNYIYCWIT